MNGRVLIAGLLAAFAGPAPAATEIRADLMKADGVIVCAQNDTMVKAGCVNGQTFQQFTESMGFTKIVNMRALVDDGVIYVILEVDNE